MRTPSSAVDPSLPFVPGKAVRREGKGEKGRAVPDLQHVVTTQD